MPIDWFTVIAQAINFLILVWLLKRFLYQPILHAIDEREQGIAARLAAAEAKEALAQKERDDFQHKNDSFDQERTSLLKTASDEANAERQRLLDKARQDADALRAKRQETLRSEQQNLTQEIIHRTQKEVFAITRKALADLAGTSLERRMCEVFVQRLRTLSGETKGQLAAALKDLARPAQVRSAFDLPPEQQAAIQKALNEAVSADIHIQFENVPELVSGIELSANGLKMAWSIADYLATLEKNTGELLRRDVNPEQKAVTKSEPKPEPKPEPVASAPKADH